jgi:hypothetical protein
MKIECGVCGVLQDKDVLVMTFFGSRAEGFVKFYRCDNHQRVPLIKKDFQGEQV